MDGSTRRIRQVETPEGVALPFEVASATDRLAAFAVDFALIHGVVLVLLLLMFAAAGFGGSVAVSLGLLASFFLRTFYFTFFEIRWGGATPGKRKLGLRVVSRDGGPLTAEAVLARNLTREFEVFLPLVALSEPEALLPGLPLWAAAIGTMWLLVFALLPLLGRDRLRVGDLLAGTLVVQMPRARLLEDLAEFPAGAFAGTGVHRPAKAEFEFTADQLDLYGIKELQVLEDVLRRSEGHKEIKLVRAVTRKIKKKILWPDHGLDEDDWSFLSAFYKAQRARLEQKLLFGTRQADKKDRTRRS